MTTDKVGTAQETHANASINRLKESNQRLMGLLNEIELRVEKLVSPMGAKDDRHSDEKGFKEDGSFFGQLSNQITIHENATDILERIFNNLKNIV